MKRNHIRDMMFQQVSSKEALSLGGAFSPKPFKLTTLTTLLPAFSSNASAAGQSQAASSCGTSLQKLQGCGLQQTLLEFLGSAWQGTHTNHMGHIAFNLLPSFLPLPAAVIGPSSSV